MNHTLSARQSAADLGTVLHWYDFLCPFCYIAQARNDILEQRGVKVVELPFQAHPEIPAGGIPAGSRTGAMYVTLDREAEQAGLRLGWPARLPNTRLALSVAEWARRNQPHAFARLRRALFHAHFVLGEDLGDREVVDKHALAAGLDLLPVHAALADGSATRLVTDAEDLGRRHGVRGTPAWLIHQLLINGLRSVEDFEYFAESASQAQRKSKAF
jgi:predicted DsbA family dithiol-disulfide isomerase